VRPSLTAAVSALFLLVISLNSTPRRVGDGGEYLVMTERLASFQNPALTRAELDEAKKALAALGAGFESALLDYPLLVGADGRQSFLHFWLYPLIATPGMWLAHALQLHPNWAFTITNIVLLVAAVYVLARVAPSLSVLYALAAPIVWWVDKAHTEVFLYAALIAAVAAIDWFPVAAMLGFAAAGAQNAAVAATYPLFAAVTLLLSWRAGRLRAAHGLGAAAGTLIVAMPLVYNWLRLGRAAPMSEYAHLNVPSVFAMLGFVLEPNIGLAPAMPGFFVTIAAVVLALVLRRQLAPALWWPIVIQLGLLVVWTQNPNANHGGTPGVNRWTLSLVPLTLPWVGAAYTALPRRARDAVAASIIATASYSVYIHLPHRPERYLQPTTLAQELWNRGWVRTTAAEVFAERTAGNETPMVPIPDDGCGVVLAWDMQWPLECVPPAGQLPAACAGVESFCLVAQHGERVDAAPVPFNGFFFRVAPQSWPASGPLASGLRAAMKSIDPNARRWQIVSERELVREKHDVGGLALLRTPKGVLVYIARTGPAAAIALRAASPVEGSLVSLLPWREIATLPSIIKGDHLTRALPPNASNLVMIIHTRTDR
jgi:hypothetical protein